MLVVATHALVAESVRAALAARGYAPVATGVGARSQRVDARVGLLVTHDPGDITDAARVIWQRAGLPWLVMAPDQRGPTWGAFYASGATLVVPPDVTLDEACALLDALATGRRPWKPRRRRELVRQWQEAVHHREEVEQRLGSLTARELEVLRELYAGVGVSGIAQRSEVTEATVRTQVKAILRKLDVSSQIAAVAAFSETGQARRT